MNRIDRLHAILTHLQSKKRVTAQEIADRFNISLRTVYRDVKALDESGVPVIGEAGSGYSMMEGYRLPPVMFNQEEAAALLLAGKLAEQMTDASVKKSFDTALYKIKAVLRSADKDHVEALTGHIEVLRSKVPEDEPSNQYLAALQKAIVDKHVVFIQYSNLTDEITERLIEPIGLCHYSRNWHIIGWCRLRNGYRDFRLGRIKKLVVKDESFKNASHPSIQEYIKQMTNTSELQEVVVLFDKEVTKYIREQKYYYGFVSEEPVDDKMRMKFLTCTFEGIGRWLLMFTNTVTIESPARLQTAMYELLEEINAHYGAAEQAEMNIEQGTRSIE